MTLNPSSSASVIRLAFWRAAATAADLVLRNRDQLLSAWPYATLLAGGLLAYAMGRLVGLLAFGIHP